VTHLETPGLIVPTARAPQGNGMGLDDSVYQRLLRDRIIFLGSVVEDQVANAICAQLLLLAAEDPHKDIYLYVNSPGGSVSAGFAIYDTMQYVPCSISTVAIGRAASFGTVILMAGTKGRRFALPNARIHLHQPMIAGQGLQGQASDLEIHAREVMRVKEELNKLIAQHTGRELDRVQRDTDRDFYLSPQEAIDYGLIDGLIGGPSVEVAEAALAAG